MSLKPPTGHSSRHAREVPRFVRDDGREKMKFSVNWLREFVELPPSIDELAELLTMAGVEIEGIEKRGANFDNVVVAQITASTQHPNADRLTVCTVDDGSGPATPDRLRREKLQGGRQSPAGLAGRGFA